MAVVSLPTSVTPAANAICRDGTAGATIAAGEVVCLSTVTNRYILADADLSLTGAAAIGIALNGAASGQPIKVIVEGTLENCASLKQGQTYVLANTAGDIAEALSDLTEDTSYVTFVGIGLTTTSLKVKCMASGVVLNAA